MAPRGPALATAALTAALAFSLDGSAYAVPPGHTVFVLDQAVPLTEVARAVAPTSTRPVAFEHRGERRGGYYGERLSLADAVVFYRWAYARWAGGEPPVFAFRLEGDVATAELGALARRVQRRVEVSPTDTVVVLPDAGGRVLLNPRAVRAGTAGTGSGGATAADEPVGPASLPKKAWAPERGFNVLYNNSGVCFPGFISCAEARGADLYLTFDRANPGADFAADWAYEHDFKLYNEENWNTDGICPAWQRNDFWAYQYDGIVWDTTMPDPYLDTGASDNCRYHDLTVGSYNPDRFVTRTYDVNMFVAPGDHGDSEYQLRGEVLDKDCEFSPWCVGIGGFSDGQLLVGTTRGLAPGCRQWVAGGDSTPC